MHVFFSYSRANQIEARALAEVLSAHGISCWIDEAQLTPGTNEWATSIRDALTRSCAVVALCSPTALTSNYVFYELSFAQQRQLKIFPVWIEGEAWLDCAHAMIAQSQYTDLRPSPKNDLSPIISALSDLFASQTKTAAPDDFRTYTVRYKDEYTTIPAFALPNYHDLLNRVYLKLLGNDIDAFSYGQSWLLRLEAEGYENYSDFDLFRPTAAFILPAAWHPDSDVSMLADWMQTSMRHLLGPDVRNFSVVPASDLYGIDRSAVFGLSGPPLALAKLISSDAKSAIFQMSQFRKAEIDLEAAYHQLSLQSWNSEIVTWNKFIMRAAMTHRKNFMSKLQMWANQSPATSKVGDVQTIGAHQDDQTKRPQRKPEQTPTTQDATKSMQKKNRWWWPFE